MFFKSFIHFIYIISSHLYSINSWIIIGLSVIIILVHVSLHIVLALYPVVFNCFIRHLVLLQSIWAILIDEIGYLLLLCFYIFKCIIVILIYIHMVFLNIVSRLISGPIEFNSISFFFKFQCGVSFCYHIHLIFLLLVHILHKSLSSLHVFNSFCSSFLLFL